MTLTKLTKTNVTPTSEAGAYRVLAEHFNPVVDQVNTIADILNQSNEILYANVTLTATEIVGTAAGDIGHTAGAILVAAPTSDYALEFVSATLIFDYHTAAYTGGNGDMVIRVGTVAQSSVVADANCIKATGDKVYKVNAIATETSLPVGSTINLFGTAFTNPGTAAGVLRVQLAYRIHETGL